MRIIRSLDDFPQHLRRGAVSIGNFDGVHVGHRKIVDRLAVHAAQFHGPTIVFTFDPHPARLLRPDAAPVPLTWTDRKAALLAEIGADAVIAYPTNRDLLELSAAAFFQRIVVEQLGAKAMVEGPNFYFGRGREGDTKHLRELCQRHEIALEIVEPSLQGQQLVSSSRIRQLIESGDVGAARRMLTQPYRIRGLVVHGDGRGDGLGYPTANLAGVDTLIPGYGIYAGRALVRDTWHWAAIHIGPSPTFGQQLPRIEAHLLDFDDSLYGLTVEIDFIEKLREIRKFENSNEFQRQLVRDLDATREILRKFHRGPEGIEQSND